jgi:HEPN domain-containing protein
MKRDEWLRYRRQAEHTLQSARRDQAAGDCDWTCFNPQQAAELALKGFISASRKYVTGHSVVKLLAEAGITPPDAILDSARELDKVFILSRYPEAYDWGLPWTTTLPLTWRSDHLCNSYSRVA